MSKKDSKTDDAKAVAGGLNAKIARLKEMMRWFYEEFDLDLAEEKYVEAMKLREEVERDLERLKNEISKVEEEF